MVRIHIVVYSLFGAVAVAVGTLGLLTGGGADMPVEERHLTRELGSAAVFVGLMAFWCAVNYAQRRPVHWALIVFAVLLSAVHWADYYSGNRPLASGLVNSVPLAVLLSLTPGLRRAGNASR